MYAAIIVLAFVILLINLLNISTKSDIIKIVTEKQTETIQDNNEIKKEIHNELEDFQKKEKFKNTISELVKNTETINEINTFTETLLRNFANKFSIVQGIFFVKQADSQKFTVSSTYAYYSNEKVREFETGEGISGQVAKNKEMLIIDNIPENYLTVISGLGSSSPKHLLIAPLLINNEAIAIIELASFIKFEPDMKEIFGKISVLLSDKISSLLNYKKN